MTARILNGSAIRDQIYAELQQEIAALGAAGIRPGLAAVLVGENAASQIYVRSKIAACEQLGLGSWLHTPSAHGDDRRNARADRGTQRARRCGRNPRAASASRASGHQACARGRGPCERRGRFSSGESGASGLGPRGTCGLHARRGAWKFCGAAAFPSKERTRSSSGAATSWENRWRCC